MPSPFPGMDPYLEDPRDWPGFHVALITAFQAALTPLLPERYFASIDEHVWLTRGPNERGRVLGRPDVLVPDRGSGNGSLAEIVTLTIPAPTRLKLPAVRGRKRRYLQILDARNRRVVTVVELLSPSNKTPGNDRRQYLDKRSEYARAGVNLVEVDLLRGGLRMPTRKPGIPACDYAALVGAAVEYPDVGVWTWSVRDPLPDLPVPLDVGEPVVTLPLKPCLDRVYHDGGFERKLDYRASPVPPLTEADAAWANELLKEKGIV